MNGNKKLDVSRVSETESAPDKKSAPMKCLSRFLPLPHVLDLRSLALFRILFGLCQLGDIYGRLCTGKYDLAWYTSEPEDRSYYYPGMPTQDFQGFLGKTFLFQRGSYSTGNHILCSLWYLVDPVARLAFNVKTIGSCRAFGCLQTD